LLLSRQVDGIISVPSALDAPALAHASASGIPVVSIDWEAPGLETDAVVLDNVGAGNLAGRHLADHGHSAVGIVVGADEVSTMRDRLAGFDAAFASPGDSDSVSVGRAALTVEGGRTAMHGLLQAPNRPTAVFAANYELTVGALIALNESGLRLGQDISVIGFDSVELAQVTRPRLTIVAQPVEEIAKEAARLIQHRLDTREPDSLQPVTTRLPGALVAGSSVADLRD
jgi:DNA-binding LacI/PurR family transcriptional regulator